ncbi:hypothetical protein B0H11DRAFT_453800 [Mycena galericulata]|nr:hypothetical protein B0H11DRAFT_453800 [Mycena galericulata]
MSKFQSQQSQPPARYKISPAHESFFLPTTMLILPILLVLLVASGVVLTPVILYGESHFLGLEHLSRVPGIVGGYAYKLISSGYQHLPLPNVGFSWIPEVNLGDLWLRALTWLSFSLPMPLAVPLLSIVSIFRLASKLEEHIPTITRMVESLASIVEDVTFVFKQGRRLLSLVLMALPFGLVVVLMLLLPHPTPGLIEPDIEGDEGRIRAQEDPLILLEERQLDVGDQAARIPLPPSPPTTPPPPTSHQRVRVLAPHAHSLVAPGQDPTVLRAITLPIQGIQGNEDLAQESSQELALEDPVVPGLLPSLLPRGPAPRPFGSGSATRSDRLEDTLLQDEGKTGEIDQDPRSSPLQDTVNTPARHPVTNQAGLHSSPRAPPSSPRSLAVRRNGEEPRRAALVGAPGGYGLYSFFFFLHF